MTTRRWLQPELWLVLALPLATIAGGLLTLRAVAGDLSTDGAAENVRRTAQVQTAELDPDLAAARRGLSARLVVDRARGQVRVHMPAAAAGTGMEVSFLHPLQAQLDLHAALQAREGRWSAPLSPATGSRWRVVLSDRARSWRLVGTLPAHGGELQLRPALPPR